MLSNDEQAAFLASIEGVCRKAANHLGSNLNASSAVGFAANLQRSVDKVVQQAGDPKPECKPGCAWCCSLFVEATEPEIFLIAREIRKGAPEEVQAILETLRVRAAVTKDDAKNLRRRDCAFLKNKRCSIYEVRPSTCRKAHSLSAESCGNFASEIPQKLEILLGAEALIQGTADAYRQLKLHASAHELCNAVLLALSDDTAEARWYNGETVFPRDGA
jgi:Fe-S-cluster containining protein